MRIDGAPLEARAVLVELARLAALPGIPAEQIVRWWRVVQVFGIQSGGTVIVPPSVRPGESGPFAPVNHPGHPRKSRVVAWAPRT